MNWLTAEALLRMALAPTDEDSIGALNTYDNRISNPFSTNTLNSEEA
jgi:hypothetical protein